MYRFHRLPKQTQQLGSKCSNTRAYRDISHANQTEVVPVGSLRLHHCFVDRVKCRTSLPKGVNPVFLRSSGSACSLVWGHSSEIPSNTAAGRLLGPEGGPGARWLSLPGFRILASFNLHNTLNPQKQELLGRFFLSLSLPLQDTETFIFSVHHKPVLLNNIG